MGKMGNTNVGVQGVTWAVFGAEALGALFDLRWMLALALALVLTDLWWGTAESKKRFGNAKAKNDRRGMKDHEWHVSRAGRRTFCKIVDYLTYLLIGCVVGLAVFEPLEWSNHVVTSAVGLGLGCLCEVASIVTHVLYVKYDVEVDVKDGWKFVGTFLLNLLKKKKEDVGEALEETIHSQDKN